MWQKYWINIIFYYFYVRTTVNSGKGKISPPVFKKALSRSIISVRKCHGRTRRYAGGEERIVSSLIIGIPVAVIFHTF